MAKATTTKKKPTSERVERNFPALSLRERVQTLGLAMIVQGYIKDVDILQIMQDHEDALSSGGWCLRQLNKLGETFTPEEQLQILAGYVDQRYASDQGSSFTDYLRDFAQTQPVLETQLEPAKVTPAATSKPVVTPIKPGPADFALPPGAVDATDEAYREPPVDEVPADEAALSSDVVVVEVRVSEIVADRINGRAQVGGAGPEMILAGTKRKLEELPDVPFTWPDGRPGVVAIVQLLDEYEGQPCGRLDLAAVVLGVGPGGNDEIYVREDDKNVWEIHAEDVILSCIPEDVAADPTAQACCDVCVRFVIEPAPKMQLAANTETRTVPKPGTAPSIAGTTPVPTQQAGQKPSGPRKVTGS